MIGSLLAKIGLPVLLDVVQEGLLKIDNPISKEARNILGQLNEKIGLGQVSSDKIIEANRHIEVTAQLKATQHGVLIEQVNQSLRAEISSNDAYVRRMRPTFGYIMAVTWGAQMLAIAYTMIENPMQAGEMINAMSSLSAIWGVGLSVLGVYVYKRSEEKKIKSL